MIDKNTIISLSNNYLRDSAIYLVDVTVGFDNIIQVEIDSDRAVNIDECASLSRFLESHLDRETEDFELTVTSVGLTSPFKTLRQYQKYVGKEVEVLSKKGIKQSGILKSADENKFVLTITKKVKPEGAKRKIEVQEDNIFDYNEIKYTKYLLRFK